VHLELQPTFRRATKGFGQADSHLWRNAGMAIQQEGERLAADAQPRRRLRLKKNAR